MIRTDCILGRAPHTKETLPDFHEWCRVTRHPRVFRRFTGCQRTPGILGVTCLFTTVTPIIFTRIMSLESTKEIRYYLKNEYVGDERIKGMQIFNLVREFELQGV